MVNADGYLAVHPRKYVAHQETSQLTIKQIYLLNCKQIIS